MNLFGRNSPQAAKKEEFLLFVHETGQLPPMILSSSQVHGGDYVENTNRFISEAEKLKKQGYYFSHGFLAPKMIFEFV